MGTGRSATVLSKQGTESRVCCIKVVEYILIARGKRGRARLRVYDAPNASGNKIVDVRINAGEDARAIVYPPETCDGIFVQLTKTRTCQPHCEINY